MKQASSFAVNHVRSYDPFFERAHKFVQDGFIGDVHAIFCCWSEGWSFGGSHLFDLLRMFSGSRPVRVYSESAGDEGADPGGHALGRTRTASGPSSQRHERRRHRERSTSRARRDDSGLGDFHIQLLKNHSFGEISVPTEWPFFARMEMRSAMTTLVEEVVGAVGGGPAPRSGIDEGRQALELAVALNESTRLGKVMNLPLREAQTIRVDTFYG